MLDQTVDLCGVELIEAAQGAELATEDVGADALALHDVDVLIGLIGVVAVANLDEHAPPR